MLGCTSGSPHSPFPPSSLALGGGEFDARDLARVQADWVDGLSLGCRRGAGGWVLAGALAGVADPRSFGGPALGR